MLSERIGIGKSREIQSFSNSQEWGEEEEMSSDWAQDFFWVTKMFQRWGLES